MHPVSPRTCRVCGNLLTAPYVGRAPVFCSTECRRADRAVAARHRRAREAAASTSEAFPPRDPANAAEDANRALASVSAVARRVCRLAFGFEGDGVNYFDDEIAEVLTREATDGAVYDEALVRRIRERALDAMRATLRLSAAERQAYTLSLDEEPEGVTRSACGALRPSSRFDELAAALRDGDPSAPLPLVEVALSSTGTRWDDRGAIAAVRDPAARWVRETFGDGALADFPRALA